MAWGAVKGIAIHHSDSPEQDKHERCVQTAASIRDYHMRNGYRDVAYTRFGCRHGKVFEGRGFGDNTGANGTTEANKSYPSICIIGDHPKPSEGVVEAVRSFRAEVLRRWPTAREVKPHKAFTATACPGVPLTQWVRDGKYEEVKEEDELAKMSEEAQVWWEKVYRHLKTLDPNTNEGWAKVLIEAHRRESDESHDVPPHSHTGTVKVS